MKNQISLKGILLAFLFSIALVSANAQQKAEPLKYGKYNCTASTYKNGSYEFIPRGSFVITKSGNYSYSGFDKKSTGKFTIDAKGNLIFKGGYLDGGKAEKIDRPDKFFLVFPSNPDNRWTASFISK
jgi:hypothetical protein